MRGKTTKHQIQLWVKVQVLFSFHQSPWYSVCPLTLTDVHSFAQTNELLSYVSVCYESVTWLHCAPFPITSFIDYHFAAILSGALAVNGQWRTYRRMCVAQKNVQTRMCARPHTGQEQSDILQPRCSDLARRSHVLAIKKAPYPTTMHFHISSYFLLTLPGSTVPCGSSPSASFFQKQFENQAIFSDIFTVIKLLRSFPKLDRVCFSCFPSPGWYTVNGLSCWLFPARIITIEESQYGSTDGSFYLVHKYICWLILGPTPLRAN